MNLDLLLLGLVLLFALLGAVSGGARQIAHWVGLAVAGLASRVLGPFVGPEMAEALGAPLLVGTVVGSILVFLVLWVSVRYALTAVLRRLFGANHPERQGMDRAIGFVLGGGKVALLVYGVLSALVFAEQYFTFAGKHLGLSPKNSVSFALARRYNLFELTQFSAVKDLVAVSRATTHPEQARRLAKDPAFKALKQDKRFQQALSDKALREALEKGDTQTVLRSNVVLQLLQDPQVAARLGAAARASESE